MELTGAGGRQFDSDGWESLFFNLHLTFLSWTVFFFSSGQQITLLTCDPSRVDSGPHGRL